MEFTAYGDTMNLGARMEEKAEPGTVYISENTHRAVSGYYEFESLGLQKVKGKDGDPWNAYSGYNGISIPTTETAYSFTFTMTNPTDMNARLVFDFGMDTTGVSVAGIKVDELILMTTSLDDPESQPKVNIYPNPFDTFLYFRDTEKFDLIEVYDLQGKLWKRAFISSNDRMIYLDDIPQGMFMLRLEGNGIQVSIKIIKE